MTDTDVTFLFCYNIIGHAHMHVMTFTPPPLLPLSRRLLLPGARSGLPCPVPAPACCCRGRLAGAGSGSHSGVELWRIRTGKGSSGGRKKLVV